MTRKTPDDRAFNLVVREQIESGLRADEKLVFITTENQVAEVLYASEFRDGVPTQIRNRLEKAGRLKGVVHVSALNVGDANHAPRLSLVEYLPDGQLYQFRFTPSRGAWEEPELDQLAQSYKKLWENREEKP